MKKNRRPNKHANPFNDNEMHTSNHCDKLQLQKSIEKKKTNETATTTKNRAHMKWLAQWIFKLLM